MHPMIRKTLLSTETLYTDGAKAAGKPLVMIAAAAVIKNPWAGQGYVEDLGPKIRELAPVLGELLTGMIVKEAGGGERVEAFGKCAVVGIDGELEHASALIHTLHFGNHSRQAPPPRPPPADGRRAPDLPAQVARAAAPAGDEIVVALGAALGGRPHHRIGNRYLDLKELGHDAQNPAAV